MPAVLILTILLIVPFWLLIIRPQQRRQHEHRAFLEALEPGDRIEGFSGLHGTITRVGDDTVDLEIASGVVVTMAKLAVSCRVDAEGHRRPLGDPGEGHKGGRSSVEDTVKTAEERPIAGAEPLEGESR